MHTSNRWLPNTHGPTNHRSRTHIKLTSLMVFLFVLSNLVWMPGAAQAQAVVQPPVFSVPRGFYSNTFNLTLSAPAGTIYYTTNGDSPVSFTSVAPAPGAIQYNGGNISINGTRVVRAAVISGGVKSAVVTHTYIFLNQVRNQPDTAPAGMPANAVDRFAADDPDVGYFPSDFGMDPEVLNHPNYSAPGKFESVMKSLPTLSLVTDLENMWDPNYGIQWNSNAKEGHEDYPLGDPFNNPVSQGKWERPVSLEWINPDGTTGFQQDGGMRMHGQASRRPKRTPKKSIRIYFKKGYGVGNLDFQLFSDATAVGKFDRLVLRNGGNRSWPYFDRDQRRETDYVNDEMARQAWQEMGHLAPHGTYVHLYINGLYWGLYNVAERIDEKYLASYHPGLLETDFDLIESEEEQDDNSVASVGDMTAYNTVMGLVDPMNTTPLTNATYNQLKTLVDMNSLADYFIHVHYIGKTDWPDHNYNLYRARVGPDTRFKFIAWDNDSGLNKVLQNTTLMTETMTHPFIMGPEGQMVPDTTKPLMYDAPLQIFNRLTTNPEFRQLVTDRFYKHVVDPTGTLAPARCAQIYTELTGIVDQAVIAESARWGDYSRDKYPPTNFVDQFDKPFPAYLHSRDLPNTFTDPANAVLEENQKNWVQVRTEKLNTYCPNRSGVVLSQYQANGWYVAPLNVPGISQRGGLLPANNTITLNNTANGGAGDIYYTTNGVDPRVEFGAIAPTATKAAGTGADSASIVMPRATTLKARVYNSANNTWSPLLEYVFAPNQPMQNLVVNEIHYAPSVAVGQDAKQYEFIELYNNGQVPLQLDRVKFSRGITYEFPANSNILPGQYIVLASNAGIFQSRYSFTPFGTFAGSLANEGEPVELVDAVGNPVERTDFKPIAPWPVLITGGNIGKSLSLNSPTDDVKVAGSWRASNAVNGTPGAPNGHVAQGKQVPTILVNPPLPITYGQPLTANQYEAVVSGPPGNAAGTWSYNPPLGTVMNAGYGQTLSVTFTPNDTTNYAPATATTTIDVLRAPLTVTADSTVWQQGTLFPTLTATYSGFVNGDTPAVLDTPPTISTSATDGSPVGDYPIIASGGSDNNYDLSYVNGTFTVSNKTIPMIAWANPEGLTYGAALGSGQLNAAVSYGGMPVAGNFTYNPPLGTALNAGGHTLSVTFTPADTNTYATVTKNVTINISKAPLVIRAENKYKQVGTANPTLTASYSGLVNGDSAATLDTPPVLSTTATTSSPVGVYPITVSSAADANYNITLVSGELTVGTEPPTLQLMLPMVVGVR